MLVLIGLTLYLINFLNLIQIFIPNTIIYSLLFFTFSFLLHAIRDYSPCVIRFLLVNGFGILTFVVTINILLYC